MITTDGLRWQEVFNGMDFALANAKKFNHGDSAYLYNKYGSISVTERQTKLLPFFWQSMAKNGLLFGNRFKENKVDVANPYQNVLAFLQKQKAYQNKVIAFGAWDAYNRKLNEAASGFPVINGFENLSSILKDPQTKILEDMLQNSYKPFK